MPSQPDTAREILSAPSDAPAPRRAAPCQPEPTAQRAAPVEFPLEASVGAAFEMVLRSGLAHLLANEAAALAGKDPEGIHQIRVAVRRMRSALRFFRKALDADGRRQARTELRWLAGALGPARDWDVLVTETLKRPALRAAARKAGAARLAEEPRAAAHAAAREALRSPRYGAAVLRLEALIADGGRGGSEKRAAFAGRPMADAAPKLIGRSDAAARAAGAQIARLDVAERHALRKQLKELRYAASFLRPLYPSKPAERYAACLGALQDVLGELNDYETARLLLGDRPDAAPLLAAAERQSAKTLIRLPEAWRGFRRAKRFWEID
jgi:CHAD domain-containing protein